METQEKPSGKGCATTLYEYDEESNRIGETVRKPGTDACATSGGVSTSHEYDTAGRMVDPGTEYEPDGGVSAISAQDAGGHEVAISYYQSGAVYTQEQSGQTNTYTLDPIGRALQTTVSNPSGEITVTTSHYSGPSSGAAWPGQSNGAFSRSVLGIDGATDAVQTASGVSINITNLHGDVVGSAPDASGGKPTLTSEPSAFGASTSGTGSAGSGWLGSVGIQSELPSGISGNGSGGTYIPQVGLTLEPAGLSGSALQDPVNEYLADRTEAQPFSSSTGTLPGAIEPLPVNSQIEHEFWENPPWAPPPQNAPEFVDPHFSVKLGGGGAELIRNLIKSGAVQALATYIVKWAKIGGLEAQVIAELIVLAGHGIEEGLDYCVKTFNGIGRPGGKDFRCEVTFNWIQSPFGSPPVIIPENVEFKDCFWDEKKKNYDCGTVYKVGWDLGLS